MKKTTQYYTGLGDTGKTSLSSTRLSKSSKVIEAIGTLDELNAHIGLLLAEVRDQRTFNIKYESEYDNLAYILAVVQEDLFTISSHLANVKVNIPDTKFMEGEIKEYSKTLKAIKNFVMFNSDTLSSHFNIARAIARRAERRVVHCLEKDDACIPYLNRLSTLLWVLARHVIDLQGEDEQYWGQNID